MKKQKGKSKRKNSRARRFVYRVGVDTGGTFTDFVCEVAGELRVFKLSSTPDDPSRAIREGVRRAAELAGVRVEDVEIVHGTTVGTNALLERRGARAALVTTEGFEDVLAIGRQARPKLYDLNVTRPAPLIPRELRFGVRERVAATGEVLEQLNESALDELLLKLRASNVESIAICLLFSFVNSAHEKLIAERLASLKIPLSVSHIMLPEYREYERASTVAVNAYLQPLMGAYLQKLSAVRNQQSNESDTKDAIANRQSQIENRKASDFGLSRVRVMQSSGGIASAEAAAREPVRTILSGPAGGVVGAAREAQGAGFHDIITFDMGGTSTDVALCLDGQARTTNEATVAGLAVAIPVLDIHTVGAGGGSVARVDAGGSLRVGPESAGAMPGPACYGRGGERATVTDANLVLNRFGGENLLGGDFVLSREAAQTVLERLAEEMSAAGGRRISAREAALGVLRVVNARMERALRVVSVERGYDTRNLTLVSFGGAGGLHAVELARSLKIPRVVVPQRPGALSALGVLRSDVIRDASRTLMLAAIDDAKTNATIEREFRRMEREGRVALAREGFSSRKQRHERTIAARYKGQSFELEIAFAKDAKKLIEDFHSAHESRYGYARKENPIEIVSARVRSIGVVSDGAKERNSSSSRKSSRAIAPHGEAKVFFEAKRVSVVALYEREQLPPGKLRSPAIITEYSSTTLVPPDVRACVDARGNLVIEI